MAQASSDRAGYADMLLMVRAFQISKMIQVAAALDIPDRLTAGPRPASSLARECGSDPDLLLRLCRALAAFGIFAVDAEGIISHTPQSSWLRRDAQPTLHHAARYWTTPGNWMAWGGLEEAIRTGGSPFRAVHGQMNFEYLHDHPDEAALFDLFMQHSPDDRHAAVVAAYDFSDAGLVVDVGGGNGALLAAILRTYPQTTGVLFDQHAVVAGAPATLSGFEKRYHIEGGDFFKRVPQRGDVYTLSQILHD
jgi:O-methyltransferase domain